MHTPLTPTHARSTEADANRGTDHGSIRGSSFRATLGRGAAGLALCAALTAGLAGPVLAAPSGASTNAPSTATPATPTGRTLDEIKAAGAAAISQREAQLTKLSGRLSAAPSCDADGKIAGVIAADGPALTDLGTKLAGASTLADARRDFQSIFDDYRVYLVVTPQAYAAAACGRIERATATLTGDQAKLDTRVKDAAAGGADMTAAQAALADMGAKVADATAKGNHAAATLAALAPDHGDKTVMAANATAVDAAHTGLETAHADLTAATNDARTVVAALEGPLARTCSSPPPANLRRSPGSQPSFLRKFAGDRGRHGGTIDVKGFGRRGMRYGRPVPKPAAPPIGLRLATVARQVGRAFDEVLGAEGGSRSTWLILMTLKGGPVANQRVLAESVGIDGATLTHHLNGMESDGLLTRRRDPDNRRVHLVELTEAGDAAFLRMAGAATAFDRRLRAGLTKAEVEVLEGLLGRLEANVERPGRGR